MRRRTPNAERRTSQLTVVVPALDEAGAAPQLVGDLGRQEGVSLELVLVDGGSRDGTPELVRQAAGAAGVPLRGIRASAGRAVQLNAGARAATGADLLFLHADSRLGPSNLLGEARARMEAERAERGSDRVAGHFPLAFPERAAAASLACYLLEARSRLTRPGFVTGDQGLWLSRRYFGELGGFDESLPLFEDGRLADRALQSGALIRLPGALLTSARRFAAEGFAPRLLANALLRGAYAAGLTWVLGSGAGYRPQSRAGALDLPALCRLLQRELASRGPRGALRALARAGAYGWEQAWQLPFLLACSAGRLRGLSPEQVAGRWRARFGAARRRPLRLPSWAALAAGALAFYGTWCLAALTARTPSRGVDEARP